VLGARLIREEAGFGTLPANVSERTDLPEEKE